MILQKKFVFARVIKGIRTKNPTCTVELRND